MNIALSAGVSIRCPVHHCFLSAVEQLFCPSILFVHHSNGILKSISDNFADYIQLMIVLMS